MKKGFTTILLHILLIHGLSSNEGMEHAIYLSTAKIEIAAEQINIEIKVFTDDLQNAIRNFDPNTYRISTIEQFAKRHEKEISNYFAKHFQLRARNGQDSLNEVLTTQQYVSTILQGDVYLLNFTLPCGNSIDELKVKADYFMELFPSQSNVIQLIYGSEKRFGRLKKGDEALKIIL